MKCLVIDRSADATLALKNMLCQLGVDVITASDATEARELFDNERESVDLILIASVNSGDSAEVAWYIHQTGFPGDRMIITTSVGVLAMRLMGSGCQRILTKPFPLATLRALIDELGPRP